MKKSSIIIIILVIIALFAGADYYLNNLKEQIKPKIPTAVIQGYSDTTFKLNDEVAGYKVISQKESSQIFEKIDLSSVKNTKIYLDTLEKTTPVALAPVVAEGTEANPTTLPADTAAKNSSIYLYEIHGPAGQGSLTYLSIKLEFIKQINATNEVLNETGEFGQNSFFFNDQDFQNVAFLLVQAGDNLYAFQYTKNDAAIYDDVKSIIAKIMPVTKSASNTTNP